MARRTPGTPRGMLLDPGYVSAVIGDPELDHDGRVALLAAVLICQEGGPLADELLSLTDSTPAPIEEVLDLLDEALEHPDQPGDFLDELLEHADDLNAHLEHSERVRAFLHDTLAWPAAEGLLPEEA
jgi:hypothetical protein